VGRYYEADLTKPPQLQIDMIKGTLDKIPEDIRRSRSTVEQLSRWIDASQHDAPPAEDSDAWMNLKAVLVRDQASDAYQAELGEIVTENACAFASASFAVANWLSTGRDYVDTYTPDDSVPTPRKDALLAQIRDRPPREEGQEFGYRPDTVVPLPLRYDAAVLIERLASGACKASVSIDQEFLSRLRTLNESRRASLNK
jgi:hypothetical protein